MPVSKKSPASIADLAAAAYRAGLSLPAARKSVAASTGRDASTLYGVVDPIYFRLAGLASPLPALPKSARPGTAAYAAALASRVAARRDAGVRWETVAASTEATIGRRVSVAEAKALYRAAGRDPFASYVGRGTRAGAPETRYDVALGATGRTVPKVAPAPKKPAAGSTVASPGAAKRTARRATKTG